MGGKHKQANRTKNNARPSSSSHSAELLGNSIPTFFGFTAVKDGMSSGSGLPSEESNYSIHPDFQIIFKQMSKKDPTTRSKALQMFIDLCNQLDTASVNAMLPLWPRMYCTLCTDIDSKVRETAHKAHHAVVLKAKKMIAPYLKELAGPWFTSQYDTYPPAASAATLSFNEAFPPAKLNKAISFCQEEILSYIYDNLINHTPQTLSNPNSTSAEDMEAKYERIIISSFQGYSLYLQKLSLDQIKEAEGSNKKLLSNQKFWKYSKNKVSLIRSCFFNTLISLCQNAKFLLTEESSRLSSVVFNNLNESDPIVLHTVWDAALHILVTIEDCWTHINIEKQLFAKLCKILKGGSRNVSTIYPNILPLLSKLPQDMIKDKEIFYGNLFDNMRCSLEANIYNYGSSEGKIIATTFIECLKYVIMKYTSVDEQFCVSLVSNQLITALEQKLKTVKDRKAGLMPFLIQTSSLVHYWYSNCETNHSTYRNLVKVFFDSLFSLYENQINLELTQNSLSEVLSNQIEFLTILLNPDQFIPKNKGRVKFEVETDCEVFEIVKHKPNYSDFSKEMVPFIKKLVVVYFRKAVDNEEKCYISSLNKIVNLFEANIIFEEIVIAANESTCFKLFSSYFSKWLMNPNMKCGELVDLSFNLLKYVTYDEKEYILEEFCSNWFNDDLQFNVFKTIPKFSEDDCIIQFVRSERFAKSIINLTERFVNGNGEDTTRDIIKMILHSKRSNNEYIVDPTTAGYIVDVVSKNLRLSEVKPHVIELSQNLISTAKTEHISQSSIETLVASLFKLSCYRQENEDLKNACETGLKFILSNCKHQNLGFEFTKKLSEALCEVIMSDTITFSLCHIISNVNSFIELALNTNLKDSCSSNSEVEQVIEIIKMFLNKDKNGDPIYETGMKMIEKCCWIAFEGNDLGLEFLECENYSKMNVSTDDNKNLCDWETYPNFDWAFVEKYAKWNLYVGSVLNLVAGAHPRSYKTSVLIKPLEVYEIVEDSDLPKEEPLDDYEYEQHHTIDPDYDDDGNIKSEIILMKITKEEKSKLKNDLELINEVFHEPEYNEDNTIKPLIEDISDFLISVGIVECFNKYYSCTKYFRQFKAYGTKLKTIAKDLLKNVNYIEFEYIYNHFKTHIRKKSIWWLIKPVLREVFHRRFLESSNEPFGEKPSYIKEFTEKIREIDINKQKLHRGNYLYLFGLLQKGCDHNISEEKWDQIFIIVDNFMVGFFDNPEFSHSDLLDLSCVSRLFLRLVTTFKDYETQNDGRIPQETCLAWTEVVQTELYKKFLKTWRKLACEYYNKDIPIEWIIIFHNLSDSVIHTSNLKNFLSSDEIVEMATECGRCLTTPHPVIQMTSFLFCISLINDMVKIDTETFGNNVGQLIQETKDGSSLFNKNTNCNWTPKKLEKELAHNQGIVETLLSDFVAGDCCTVEPFTDSFTYTYSYLLLWCFILDMCGEAHSPLSYQYGCWLQEAGFCTILLESVFKLMPQTVLHGSETAANCRKYFQNYGILDFREPISSALIERTACYAFRLCLQRLPNVVRDWWSQAENKTSSLVDKVTRLYVSPLLILHEMKSVQQDRGEYSFDNMEIKTYVGSREVIATYIIDEIKMDLIMTLPQNFPLGTIKIESSNVVVSLSNWRNWLFHISKYLIHQNGTLWDALVIWKNNLDKKFEGVEQCYICFSILQGNTFEIPKVSCHTCKKKFHSNCLYKWFNTSNKSTCPICRNLF